MKCPELEVKKLHPDAQVPAYQSAGAAGADFVSVEALTIEPGTRAVVSTGLAFAIPQGYEVQVRARSGLAFKHGIMVVNAPGTIDSDYRGEIRIILHNLGTEAFEIKVGDRIAQMVLAEHARAAFVLCDKLSDTERGAGGFGSTGT